MGELNYNMYKTFEGFLSKDKTIDIKKYVKNMAIAKYYNIDALDADTYVIDISGLNKIILQYDNNLISVYCNIVGRDIETLKFNNLKDLNKHMSKITDYIFYDFYKVFLKKTERNPYTGNYVNNAELINNVPYVKDKDKEYNDLVMYMIQYDSKILSYINDKTVSNLTDKNRENIKIFKDAKKFDLL